ncbi:MAG: phasin family protein [Pseudomonadota bacterium]
MTNQTAFEDIKKAQEIFMEAIDKTTRANLASVEKMMELNKKRFSSLEDLSDPADFVAKQSTAFKEYAEEMNQQFETLTEIGNESREKLAELGQDFARNLDFSSFVAAPKNQPKSKGKTSAKSA